MERNQPKPKPFVRKSITLPLNAWRIVEREARRESDRTGAEPNISGAIAKLILR